MVKLSVGLPMYNAGKIGWLALESLCRQKNIDFEWEVVIAEEKQKNMMGIDEINKYRRALEKVGCMNIVYKELNKWIPLSEKWVLLANNSSKSSDIFVFQGADNYMHKHRLKTECTCVLSGVDWASSLVLPFYIIQTGEVFIADYKLWLKNAVNSSGMAFTVPIQYVQNIKPVYLEKGIDGWLFKVIRNYVINFKKDFIIKYDESDNWKYGFGTHGFNNISENKRYYNLKQKCKCDNSLKNLWPVEVVQRLESLKNEAKI